MESNGSKKRVIRFIGGILFLIVFVIFAFLSCRYAVHSSVCYPNYDTGKEINRYFGYDRAAFLKTQPEGSKKAFLDIMYDMKESGLEDALKAGMTEEEFYAAQVSGNSAPAETEQKPTVENEIQHAEDVETALTGPALKAQEKGLPAPPDIDINDWKYILVNAEHTLDSTYTPDLVYVNQKADDRNMTTEEDGSRLPVDLRIAEALLDFAQGCKDAGFPVFLSSGFRPYSEQKYLYERKVSQGYDTETAKTIVAYPGTSEHQTGLCCDITDYYRETKNSELENTDTYKWLAAHCAEYGFVVRYPADKSGSADSVTGVIYEPWHFRYVGTEAAKYMTENSICLEEFWELYQ